MRSEHSQTQASKGGSQLLMDSSGTVSSQSAEASDTSDGTSDDEEASSSGFQHEDAQLFEAALQHVVSICPKLVCLQFPPSMLVLSLCKALCGGGRVLSGTLIVGSSLTLDNPESARDPHCSSTSLRCW